MTVKGITNGLTKNPVDIIASVNNRAGCNDTFIKNETNSRKGIISAVLGPNKIIMDTDYYPKDEFASLHQINTKWFTNINESDYGLILEIWGKDEDGIETCTSREIDYDNNLSNTFGDSSGTALFRENCQYKFVIKSHESVPDDKYVGVDFIRLVFVNIFSVLPDYVVGGDASGAPGLEYSIVETVAVTGNGSTYKYGVRYNLGTVYQNYASINVQCTCYDDGEYIAGYNGLDTTGFTVNVAKRNGASWSGSIYVDLKITVHAFVSIV